MGLYGLRGSIVWFVNWRWLIDQQTLLLEEFICKQHLNLVFMYPAIPDLLSPFPSSRIELLGQ